MRGGIHFGVEPKGCQGCLQLVGYVGGQAAGAAAFLLLQLPGPDQPVLQFAQRILEHGNVIFLQGNIHGFATMVQEVLSRLPKLPDSFVILPAQQKKHKADNRKDRSQKDQSTH